MLPARRWLQQAGLSENTLPATSIKPGNCTSRHGSNASSVLMAQGAEPQLRLTRPVGSTFAPKQIQPFF